MPDDTRHGDADHDDARLLFAVINDIGIINQLVRTRLEARLPDGLIEAHFAVLNHLSRRPEGRMAQMMARAMQVPKTSMSHTVRVLEKRGLVSIGPHPDDARAKIVRITPQGQAIRDDVIARMIRDYAALPAIVGPENLRAIAPVLAELRGWLDAERNALDGFADH